MSKIYVQNFPVVLSHSGSIAANTTVSGSLPCAGYSTLLGFLTMSGSTETASGFQILQSVDSGAHWDHVAASDAYIDASAVYSQTIYGNAVKVSLKTGATTSACTRMLFQLKPV